MVLFLLLPVWSKLAETPLTAVVRNNVRIQYLKVGLTAHCFGLPEDLFHLWVHLDHEILFDGNFLVSSSYLSVDPFFELILENCGTDICEPLLRHFWQFEVGLREVLINFWMVVVQVLSDFLDSKSFISVMF